MTEKEMQALWNRFGESGDYLGTCQRFATAYNYSLEVVMATLDQMINKAYDVTIRSWK